MRLRINDTESAERMPGRSPESNARIEADHSRFDNRIIVETRIERRILDNHDIVLIDGMSAEAHVSRHVTLADSDARREKHMVVTDHVDSRRRAIKQPRSHVNDRIETWQSRLLVEGILGQRAQTSGFVR
jgi:hypothetical protein